MQIRIDVREFPKQQEAPSASEEARRLLAEMLTEIGLPCPTDLRKGKNGRPYADLPKEAIQFDFNFSHAGRFVVCALAVAEDPDEMPRVGVDIEIPHPRISAEKIAKRFFSESEIARLSKSAYAEEVFLDIWTKKEAYLKYTGTGLSGGMREADTEHPDRLPFPISFTSYSIPRDSAHLTVCLRASVSAPPSILLHTAVGGNLCVPPNG